MTTPKYQREDGTPTTADDPKRLLWYGAVCTFWTDDWATLKLLGPGIPCCPKCNAPGCQVTAEEWEQGAALYEAQGHDRYQDFIRGMKGKCHRRLNISDLFRSWLDAQQEGGAK